MDHITVEGVPPYDGRYELDIWGDSAMTSREWGWMKRYAGYLPLTLTGDAFGDPEAINVFAIIALRRNSKIEPRDVDTVWERFQDAPFGAAVTLEVGDPEPDGDADGPPLTSSNGSDGSSSPSSRNASESSDSRPSPTGTPASDTSVSAPVTSGS
jgi:hypothetical protein